MDKNLNKSRYLWMFHLVYLAGILSSTNWCWRWKLKNSCKELPSDWQWFYGLFTFDGVFSTMAFFFSDRFEILLSPFPSSTPYFKSSRRARILILSAVLCEDCSFFFQQVPFASLLFVSFSALCLQRQKPFPHMIFSKTVKLSWSYVTTG